MGAPTAEGGRVAGFHGDVYVGLALLVFCGVVYGVTTGFPEVPAMLSQNVPPTFFPRLVLAATAALSLALVARGLRRPREKRARVSPRVLVTAVLLTLAVFLVTRLGMLSTLFLVSILLPLYWGERRPVRIAILALALPLAIHLIFAVALGMRFPRGPW
jgi:hypothetical protein